MTRLICVGAVACALLAGCGHDPASSPSAYDIEVLQGPPDSSAAGRALRRPLLIQVQDEAGRPVSGIPVRWQLTEGNGRISPVADSSGLDGMVAAHWILGYQLGSNRVSVSVYDQPTTTLVVEGVGFQADYVSAGFYQACGIRGTELWCWGSLSAFASSAAPARAPTRVLSNRPVREVAVAGLQVCVLDLDRQPWCRGGAYDNPAGGDVVPVPNAPPVFGLAGGYGYVCGLAVADSTPWCFGGGSPSAAPAQQISSTLRLRIVSAGGSPSAGFACGLAADSTAWCWGAVPIPGAGPGVFALAPGQRFSKISAGAGHLCVVRPPATVSCLGKASSAPFGLRGVGATVLTDVPGVSATVVEAGDRRSYALLTGNVVGWGSDFAGVTPMDELRTLRITQLSANYHSCFRTTSSNIFCWWDLDDFLDFDLELPAFTPVVPPGWPPAD